MRAARCAVLLVVAVSAAPLGAHAQSLLVLPLDVEGGALDVDSLTETVHASLPGGAPAQDAAATQLALDEAAALGLRCGPLDALCAAKVGVLGGAQQVVVPHVRLRGELADVTLLLVEVAGAREQRRVTAVDAPRALLMRALAALTASLFEPGTGALLVVSDRADATVAVDGQPLGEAPVIAGALVAGAHEVELGCPGCAPFSARVDVVDGALLQLAPTLRQAEAAVATTEPTVPREPTVPPEPTTDERAPASEVESDSGDVRLWTGGAIAVVGVAIAAVAGAGALAMNSLLLSPDGRYEERAAWQTSGRVLVGAAALGLVVGAAGGSLLAVGVGDSSPSP